VAGAPGWRALHQITLREAVEAVEGPFGVVRCIMEDRACGEGRPCTLHDAWEVGQQAILEYLDTLTIEEFVSRTVSEKLQGSSAATTSNPLRRGRG
jgi:DNA-binding IscR family transcriptional regulator